MAKGLGKDGEKSNEEALWLRHERLKWVISKILNYFSCSTVFGVIRFSYFEFNHNVAEIAKFSKGDFGKRHCNTEMSTAIPINLKSGRMSLN